MTPPQDIIRRNLAETETEREVIHRMMLHLVELAKFAESVHKQENFITPVTDPSPPEIKQSLIMDPKKLNHITRLTLNEFSLYTNKNRGPLTIKGFKMLLKAIERMAADLPENLQFVISSIPVKTFIEEEDEKQAIQQIAVLRNMAITVDCGKTPRVRPFAKSFPPPNDPKYPGIEKCYAINTGKLIKKLQSAWETLEKKITEDCKNATVDDVKKIIDIFEPIHFEGYAKEYLLKKLDIIKNLILKNELVSMLPEQRVELAGKVDDTIFNIRKAIGLRSYIPLSAPILGRKGGEEHDPDFIFGGDSISETAGKARFHMAVDLCYDAPLNVAKRMLKKKIDLTRQKVEPTLPSQAAYVISANFLRDRPNFNDFVSQTATYADARTPDIQTGRIRYKSRKQHHIREPKFGSHTVIDIYPSRKLSYLNGELATSLKEHNKFMLKLEAMRLYQLNQPSEFFQLEHLIKEHILGPVIHYLNKMNDYKNLAFLSTFISRLETFINTAPRGSDYPIDLLHELQDELKINPSISMEPIQHAIDLMEVERRKSEKLCQEYQYLNLITLQTTQQRETKSDTETAIIPYRSVNEESEHMLFMYAAKKNDLELMKKLVAHGHINLNYQDTLGRTALHYATYWERMEIVKFLLGIGADPTVRDDKGETVLHISARESTFDLSTEILKLRPDIDINVVNLAGDTPAFIAVKLGKDYGMGARVASYLNRIMEFKLDLNKVDASGQTILDCASLQEDWDLIVKIMMSISNCKFPFVAAEELLKSFISQIKSETSSKIADILHDTLTEKNALGKLFLQGKTAAQFFQQQFFPLLLTEEKESKSYLKIYDTLFAKRMLSEIELKLQNKNGNTLLHLAASNEMPSVLQAAIAASADFTLKNKENQTPFDILISKNSWNIVIDLLIALKSFDGMIDPKQLSVEFFKYITTVKLPDAEKLSLLGKIRHEENALAKILSSNPSFSSELAAFESSISKQPSAP